jgi:hypothetical protein
MAPLSVAQVDAFRGFIEHARPLVEAPKTPAFDLHGFRAFTEQSVPLITAGVQAKATAVKARLDLLRPWLLTHDILSVAMLTWAEDPYTELLAWALHPDTDPGSGFARQQAWLTSLGVIGTDHAFDPVIPQTQVVTDDGIPDMVLRFDEFTVVVEAKTGSQEHKTPRTKRMQTVSYPEAVRDLYGLEEAHPVHIVYLTCKRSRAENNDAILTTWIEAAVALADACRDTDLPSDVRWAFATLITHFVRCGGPTDLDAPDLLNRLTPVLDDSADSAGLVPHLALLNEGHRLLCPEECDG